MDTQHAYRRILTRLLGALYSGAGIYAGVTTHSLSIVLLVVGLALLTYAAVQTTAFVVEHDWDHLLPPRKEPPRLTQTPPHPWRPPHWDAPNDHDRDEGSL